MEIYVSLKISKMVAKVVKNLFGHILWEQKAKKKKKKNLMNICYTEKFFLQLNAKCHGRIRYRFLIN